MADPISLTAAIVVAVIGVGLGIFVFGRMALEYRRRRALIAEAPDFDGFDPDVRRYLERVWLMIEAWKPRISPAVASELQTFWEDALARSTELQERRAQDAEASRDVAELVELEKRLEARIAAATSP